MQQKATSVEQKISAPATKIENGVNEKLSLISKEGVAGANLPGNANLPDVSLPNTTLPDTSLPNTKIDNPLSKTNNILPGQEKLSELKNVPAEQIGKVKSIDELQAAQGKLTQANQLTDKMQGVGNDVKQISQGNLGELKELPEKAEQQIDKIDELQGLQKETGAFDE